MIICVGALVPPRVSAQKADPEQLLEQADQAYSDLEYEIALKLLIKVHQTPNVTSTQKSRAFLKMGICFTALNKTEDAVQAFVELLRLQPSFRFPANIISPSIEANFKEGLLRLKLPEKAPPLPSSKKKADQPIPKELYPVVIQAQAPAQVTAGESIDVRIAVNDPGRQIEDLVIKWRTAEHSKNSLVWVRYAAGTPVTVGKIPGVAIGKDSRRLQYMVEALSEGGIALARSGTKKHPLIVQLIPTPPSPSPRKTSNWGWYALGIGGGLAVAGGVVAAILLTRGSAKPANNFADVTIKIK